jgi:hypothetical protein
VSLPQPARALSSVLAAVAVAGAMAIKAAPAADEVHGIARVGGKPQKDVVVWLDGVQGSMSEAPGRVVLNQRNLEFLPRVLAVVEFDKPGLSRIFCNIHPTMAGYVIAVDSTRFAVSGAGGRFVLNDVPPGRYSYHAWRPGAEAITGSVTVLSGQPIEVGWP